MKHAICLTGAAPLRSEPTHRSEMVSQVLFGELMQVLEQNKEWCLVKLHDDGYQGWISAIQIQRLSQEEFDVLTISPRWISTDLVQVLENRNTKTGMLVSAGSIFYNVENNAFVMAGDQYTYLGSMESMDNINFHEITRHALLFLNTPYLWGGKTAMGMDCSGFTQLVYKMCGINILRDASMQATQGEMLNLIHEAQPGDLMFFDNEEEIIHHVGIMLDDAHIIHAHGKVRIDKVDHHGIFNSDTGKYSHKLRLIKRMTP